ncbi:MAG: Phospholipase-D-nuclease N-terminal/Short C-terminal domain [Acidimicrobiaceae bacterium]|nr:Phospholipase-D-nuclease N-terminal/Short C-terminal domain [Acidimicrobiaceae bacterium]
MISAVFGVGQVAYSILWFFLAFIEVWLAIMVFIDIFRSHDLPGWAKALWLILVVVVPLVGILAYLIVRGDKMRAHQIQAVQMQDQLFRDYVQRIAGSSRSVAQELAQLAELRRDGVISEEEFQYLKAQALRHPPGSDALDFDGAARPSERPPATL